MRVLVAIVVGSLALASVVSSRSQNDFGFGFRPPSHESCRYWCRTPEGQFYCCEDDEKPPGPIGVKPGNCPPVRRVCPPARAFGPPETCSNDYSCPGSEKCCFDRCLEEHVCKPPVGGIGSVLDSVLD